MHIFSQDCGYRGGIVVVADNEEEARKIMAQSPINYEPNGPVEKEEIKNGIMISFFGDA